MTFKKITTIKGNLVNNNKMNIEIEIEEKKIPKIFEEKKFLNKLNQPKGFKLNKKIVSYKDFEKNLNKFENIETPEDINEKIIKNDKKQKKERDLNKHVNKLFKNILPIVENKKIKQITNKNIQIKNWLNQHSNLYEKKEYEEKIKTGKIIGGVGGLGGGLGITAIGAIVGGFIGFLLGGGPQGILPGALIGGSIGGISGFTAGITGLVIGYSISKKVQFNKISNKELYLNFYKKNNQDILIKHEERYRDYIKSHKDIFSKFFCPISKDIITHPVKYPKMKNVVYEKEAIEKHLKKYKKGKNSPCKKKHMKIEKLYFDFDYYPRLLKTLFSNLEKILKKDLGKSIKYFIKEYNFRRSLAIKKIREKISDIYFDENLQKKLSLKLDKNKYNMAIEYLKKESDLGKIVSDALKNMCSDKKIKKKPLKKVL